MKVPCVCILRPSLVLTVFCECSYLCVCGSCVCVCVGTVPQSNGDSRW